MTNPKSRRGGLFQIATERRKMPANGSDPVQIMKLIQPGLEEMQYRKTHTNGASVDSLSLLFRLGMPIYKRLSPGYHFEEAYPQSSSGLDGLAILKEKSSFPNSLNETIERKGIVSPWGGYILCLRHEDRELERSISVVNPLFETTSKVRSTGAHSRLAE
ncbi:hypothetical protein CUMW_257900 [Citrus unshiu]|uniref:Uncharacterized protein n=1 Tax=Citrus unshiu TaxID=55188 RepID=A0A2H5QSL8_CITUN|nr:hypothetical protein CUMW_257900 [Citrus unshiu]